MHGVPTISLLSMPGPSILHRHAKAAALLEAILKADADWRTFAFINTWIERFSLSSMDDRQGDCFAAALRADRALIAGYNEESPISEWPADKLDPELVGPASVLPTDLRALLGQQNFDHGGRTFACWYIDGQWHVPKSLTVTTALREFVIPYLAILVDGAAAFLEWVHEFYQTDIVDSIANDAFVLVPLRIADLERRLKKSIGQDVRETARAIGYPLIA